MDAPLWSRNGETWKEFRAPVEESLQGPVPVYCVVAEFVGVFLFQFIGGGADANSVSTGLGTAALGNGFAFAVLLYATAGISNGYLNPAISTALVVTGRLGKHRYMVFCLTHLLAAIFGAFMLKLALPPAMDEVPFTTTGSLSYDHPFQVFFLEFVCTFTLCWCVFATSVDKAGVAKNAAPLAIGLAVMVGVFAQGPYTGGSMNPARTLGPAIAFGQFKHVWVYLFATFAGGACAGTAYEKLFLGDAPPDKEDRDNED